MKCSKDSVWCTLPNFDWFCCSPLWGILWENHWMNRWKTGSLSSAKELPVINCKLWNAQFSLGIFLIDTLDTRALGGTAVGYRTYDLVVMGLIPGPGIIRAPRSTQLSIPLGVHRSSTSLHWLRLRQGVFTCVRWQVTLCDPTWQATPCGSDMGFPVKNLSCL